jgi:hypothetical protein
MGLVKPDLLEALKVIPELHVKIVGDHLGEAAVLVILLPVQEPVRDFESTGVCYHSHEALKFIRFQLPSSVVVNIKQEQRISQLQQKTIKKHALL